MKEIMKGKNMVGYNTKNKILMSIKPKYVKTIFNGEKKYEFRRIIFKRKRIDEIIIYSSSPERKIVGSFKIKKVFEKNINDLWEICKSKAGISFEEFFKYFTGKEMGYAIEMKSINKFTQKIDPYELFPKFRPPLSFCYLDNVGLFSDHNIKKLNNAIKKQILKWREF